MVRVATMQEAQAATSPGIVVVIPAYNEERFIGTTVLKARRFARTVIVVDDGSMDATARIAEAAGAVVVRHMQNQGKGVALNTGFRKARALNPDVVVTLDADGQHVPEELPIVTTPVLEQQADIVVGSRYLMQTSKVPSHRIWGHHVFNFMTNHVSGVRLTDSQSGFRAFSPRALQFLSFTSRSFSVESEMQFLASEHNLKTLEVPITIHYHDRPKRPVINHGLIVLQGVLKLIGQYRPLLFFGIPGLVLLLIGLAWGVQVVSIYRSNQILATGYALITVMFDIIGVLVLFTGIILHSVRGLLLDLVRPGNSGATEKEDIATIVPLLKPLVSQPGAAHQTAKDSFSDPASDEGYVVTSEGLQERVVGEPDALTPKEFQERAVSSSL